VNVFPVENLSGDTKSTEVLLYRKQFIAIVDSKYFQNDIWYKCTWEVDGVSGVGWINGKFIEFGPPPAPIVTETPTAVISTDPTQIALGTPGELCDNFSFDPTTVDVTILDGTQITPGQDFVKTWKIKNTGICPWGDGYGLTYAGYADKMSGEPVPLGTVVAVGQEINVSVKFRAPTEKGTYTSAWQMAKAKGIPFGKAIFVKIVVKADGIGLTDTSAPEATQTIILAPTQTPNPTQTLQAALTEVRNQFEDKFSANIAFNRPKQMEKDATTSVELILSQSVSAPTLAAQVVERGDLVISTTNPDTFIAPGDIINTIETKQIEITQYLKAELKSRDPEAFIVTDMLDTKQLVSLDKPTTWRWSVKAKKEGTHTLELIITQLVKHDGEESWGEVESFTTDIVVEVKPIERVKSWDWKWIAGFILALVGSVLGVLNWQNNKKKKAEEEKPVQSPKKKKKQP
jgi:hypothetical protein